MGDKTSAQIHLHGTVHQVATGDHATLVYRAPREEELLAASVDTPLGSVELSEEANTLRQFIADEEKLSEVIDQLRQVCNVRELAFYVVAGLREVKSIDRYKVVKSRFIKALLSFTPLLTKGNSVNNVREQINKMLEAHKWPR